MKTLLNIGIIDDEDPKATQISIRLEDRFQSGDGDKENWTTEKLEKFEMFEFSVHILEIEEGIDKIIEQIQEKKLDAVIVDYKLSSYKNVDYNGVDLAKEIEEKFYGYPIFILTAYEDDLFSKEIFNAYQVFDFKRYLEEIKERLELHFKIIEQILKSKKQKEQWEKRLQELMPRMGESAEIDSEILEIDSKLERAIDGRNALPLKMKQDLNSSKLVELIEKIDNALKED